MGNLGKHFKIVSLFALGLVLAGSFAAFAGTADKVAAGEKAAAGFVANAKLPQASVATPTSNQPADAVKVWRAKGEIVHIRKGRVLSRQTVYNVKTTVGIDYTFLRTYGTTNSANEGLNWIALSNDTLTETTASTTLSTEIAANGLARAQGTYAHTAGTSTATISKTFTCATSAQSAQKAALFSASSGGTMHHALAFTQRALQVGDQLAVTFTITLT